MSSPRSPTSNASTRTGRSSSTATSMPSARAPSARRSPHPTPEAPLGTPLFVLNLKLYEAWLGPRADEIGRSLQEAAQRRGVAAALAPSTPDIGRMAITLKLPLLGQHVDFGPAGARTGFVVPEGLRAAGAR